MINNSKYKSFINNTSWLFIGKILQMSIFFLINIITARVLGPSEFGILGLITTYVSFFIIFSNLGINNVIINELNRENDDNKVIGTSIGLNLFAGIISWLMLLLVASRSTSNELNILILTSIQGLLLIFNSCDVITYWYQSKLNSKTPILISLFASLVYLILRLISIGYSNIYFIVTSNLCYYVIIFIILLISYLKSGRKLTFSYNYSLKLFNSSKHYILAGLFATLNNQLNILLLQYFFDSSSIGFYNVAFTVSTLYTVIPATLITSFNPIILKIDKSNHKLFKLRNTQVFAIVFSISMFCSLLICLGSKFIIGFLYGEEYFPSIILLNILVWAVPFSYMGVFKNTWLVYNNKQKYNNFFILIGLISNLIFSLLALHIFGIIGIAVGAVFSQLFSTFVATYLFKDTRELFFIMKDAMLLKNINFMNLIKKFNIKKWS